ncbi:hypothetical protein ACXHXG_29890 [Rhizobium sp. LEGMi198b]
MKPLILATASALVLATAGPAFAENLTTSQLRTMCESHSPQCGQWVDKMFYALVELGKASAKPIICPSPDGKPQTKDLIDLFLKEDASVGASADQLPAVAVVSSAFQKIMPCP